MSDLPWKFPARAEMRQTRLVGARRNEFSLSLFFFSFSLRCDIGRWQRSLISFLNLNRKVYVGHVSGPICNPAKLNVAFDAINRRARRRWLRVTIVFTSEIASYKGYSSAKGRKGGDGGRFRSNFEPISRLFRRNWIYYQRKFPC